LRGEIAEFCRANPPRKEVEPPEQFPRQQQQQQRPQAQFQDILQGLSVAFQSNGPALAFLGAAGSLVIQFLKNKSPRGVTIKFGTTEITVKDAKDLDHARETLQALQAGVNAPPETPPRRSSTHKPEQNAGRKSK
jgi:hypothetical protein